MAAIKLTAGENVVALSLIRGKFLRVCSYYLLTLWLHNLLGGDALIFFVKWLASPNQRFAGLDVNRSINYRRWIVGVGSGFVELELSQAGKDFL